MNLRRFVNCTSRAFSAGKKERLLSKLLSVYPYRGGVIDEAVFVWGVERIGRKNAALSGEFCNRKSARRCDYGKVSVLVAIKKIFQHCGRCCVDYVYRVVLLELYQLAG